ERKLRRPSGIMEDGKTMKTVQVRVFDERGEVFSRPGRALPPSLFCNWFVLVPAIMLYRNRSQSTTSLSDNDDDDINHSTFFAPADAVVSSPAQWHSRLHNLSSASRTHTPSPASLLPPEILIHILKHLHSLADLRNTLMVSRAWCECSVELLWHKPSIPDYPTVIKIMQVLARDDQTFTYSQFIRRLNFLSVGPDLADNVFARLAQCTRLERITLVNCTALSDHAIARTVPSFKNLVAIDLSSVSAVTENTVLALAKNCRKLQGINLFGCQRVTSFGILALAENCPLLRRVKLSGVDQVTDDPVSALATQCPLLLEIDLNGCKRVTDLAVRDIWMHSNHMREMRLSQCVKLTDAAFPAPPVPFKLPPSSERPLNPFPQSSALNLPQELPPLRLNRLFEHLRMLDLTNCSQITDDAIDGIVACAPKIRNLVLAKCTNLTDRAVESICRLGKHLHYLHLGHASEITDRSVTQLARSCARLRYIDLANCNQLTDMSVFELSNLQKLRRIGLVRVNNLTDQAIFALGDRHATLERVHLSYCDQISVMSIHFLLQRLHHLNHLSLTGIPSFRRPELQQFCREPPSDFNSTQQQAFCVFSGEGVNELRKYLLGLFNSITEMKMEYEDEDDDSYTGGLDDVEMETDEVDEEHPFAFPPQSRPAQPASQPQASTSRLPDATRVSSPPLWDPRASSSSAAGPSVPAARVSSRWPLFSRPIFGSPPPSSPEPSDGSAAGFFRTYNDAAQAALRSGALTPDLVFAELGHGRGANGAGPSLAHAISQTAANSNGHGFRSADAELRRWRTRGRDVANGAPSCDDEVWVCVPVCADERECGEWRIGG
ncbi:hypothetical protein EW146_g10447, partial [Bondarzewia mesenterica]